LQVIVLLVVFVNRCLNWSEVLLVAKINVIQEWALAWEESACELERFSMPVLTFLLLCGRIEAVVFLHLYNKTDLGRITEVCNG